MASSKMQYTDCYDSPVGRLTLACESGGRALTGLWIEGQRFFGSTLTSDSYPGGTMPVIVQTKRWLDRYFSGKRPLPGELPLAPEGSVFRQRVWKVLLEIPYGKVMTYGEIAHRLAAEDGRIISAQAVGGAAGHNPIAIIIPCHRVIGARGNLTGYAGGIAIKQRLLKSEGVNLPDLL